MRTLKGVVVVFEALLVALDEAVEPINALMKAVLASAVDGPGLTALAN